jgi:hypothetical protein
MSRWSAALAALALFACADEPAAQPEASLLAERAPLVRLLTALSRLEGTPLGRRAAELAAALPDCPRLEARAPEPDAGALAAGLRCAEGAEPWPHDLRLTWPLPGDLSLAAWLDVDERGGIEASFELPGAAAHGARALLLPGPEPPGPAVLSGTESLLQARVRPAGGLDLAALVPEGGQGDRMFRLKSELFRGVVLDGSWEAALYLPGEGEPLPRAALALGFSNRAAAVAAAEDFLAELARTWPVRRSYFSIAGADGACLLDLRILPAFAPCYLATERALVVGYNPASLRKALDGAPPALGEAGGLLLDFARFAESDARLAGSAPGQAPWCRLRAEPEPDGDAVRVHVRLDPRTDA